MDRIPRLGIHSMTSGCLECVYDFVQTINQIPNKSIRDGCIASSASADCQENMSQFKSCSGFDITKPVIMPYCSDKETGLAVGWSFYRSIIDTCLGIAKDESSMMNCASFVAINSGDLKEVSGECFGCWSELSKAIYNQPATVKSACSADATSDGCVYPLASHLVSFTACTGLNPISTDFDYIRNSETEKSASISSLAVLIIVTLLTMTL